MDRHRWLRVERELDRLLELDAGERAPHLAELAESDADLGAEVARLLEAAARPSPLDGDGAGAAPDLVRHAAARASLDAGDRLGAWEVLGECGAGGMGKVYLARRADGAYQRRVALKILHRGLGGLEGELRFRREQRILAGFEHEGIARLYDAGVAADGRPWLAMELIDGVDLLEHCRRRRLPIEERLRLVERVCRAVGYAHRLGIVHRDLKPSNLLVVEEQGAAPRPVVLDFGIARDLAQPDATLTGHVLGTPGYMAPEQVAGDRAVDRRADVFALGVLLYELITGRRPYAAPSAAEELHRLFAGEPERPRSRARGLSRDLEAIVLACLERDPDRRYPSAAALGDDLARFLDGEAPTRRPEGWLGRGWRRARRRPAVAALVAAAVLAALGTGWWSWRVSALAEERAELARRFGAEAERVDATMRVAHLSPLHDLTPHRERLRADLDRLAHEMERLGRSARAPGHLALGRGRLALGDAALAVDHLETARRFEPGRPAVALALAAALAELYRVERAEALRLPAELREAELERLARERRDRALAALDEAGDDSLLPELLRARIAAWEGRPGEARRRAARAVEARPWLYEAWLLEGDLAFEEAFAPGAGVGLRTERLAAAEDAYRRAAATGASDPRTWESLCRVAGRRLEIGFYEGPGELDRHAREVEESCGNALVADPGRVAALIHRSRVRARWAESLMRRGEDPAEGLALARADAEAALAADPTATGGLRSLADALVALADAAMERGGGDPRALDEAIELLERAVHLDPRDPGAWNSLGLAWWSRAEELRQRDLDPVPALDAGIGAFGPAIDLRPRYSHALSNRGALRRQRMEVEIDRGGDPRTTFAVALDDLTRALEANAGNSYALNNLGNLHRQLGEWRLGRRQDPREDLVTALDLFERAAAANPAWSTPVINAGSAHAVLALAAAHLGLGDPEEHFRVAGEAFRAADALKPGFLLGLLPYAESLAEQADGHRESGRAGRATRTEAARLLDRLRTMAPEDPRVAALDRRLAGL